MSTAIRPDKPFLGAMLRRVWQWVRDRIAEDVLKAGFVDLNAAHLQVFCLPTLDGVRPSELAAELRISKQAVNELLGRLERRGYVVRERDRVDGRARAVRLTARGRRLEKTARSSARRAERRIADLLGSSRSGELWKTFERLTSDLQERDGDRRSGRAGVPVDARSGPRTRPRPARAGKRQ